MSNFQGAVIREQGVTFAVVIVRPNVVANRNESDRAIQSFSHLFPSLPIVLMAQDSRGRATYFGRPDLAKFLASVPLRAIPWREYSVS